MLRHFLPVIQKTRPTKALTKPYLGYMQPTRSFGDWDDDSFPSITTPADTITDATLVRFADLQCNKNCSIHSPAKAS